MALPTTTAMMTNEEVVATATEASKLVLMNSTTTSQDEDDSDDLDVNVDKKKKYFRLKVAAAAAVSAAAAAATASILVMGGTTLFSSVEINTLRTSTTSNTAEGTTSTTTNVDGCCNVATGSFDQGSLQDCYTTDCGFLDSGCADEIYCWSNKRFNSDGDSEGCEPQGDFSTVDPGDIYENYCGNPCGTFASHTC